MKTYIIAGNPIPLARPRFSFKRIYDKQQHEKFIAGIELAQQHGDLPFLSGPLHLDVTFFMASPHSYSKNKKSKLWGQYHIIKPDLSNLLKFYEDLCSEVIFKDDCIIASISCKKLYDEHPRTEFTLRPL